MCTTLWISLCPRLIPPAPPVASAERCLHVYQSLRPSPPSPPRRPIACLTLSRGTTTPTVVLRPHFRALRPGRTLSGHTPHQSPSSYQVSRQTCLVTTFGRYSCLALRMEWAA